MCIYFCLHVSDSQGSSNFTEELSFQHRADGGPAALLVRYDQTLQQQ